MYRSPPPPAPPLVFYTAGECTSCGGTGTIPPPDVCECDWSGCGCVARPCVACGRDVTMRRLRALRDEVADCAVFDGSDVAVLNVPEARALLARIADILAGRDDD